MDKYEKLKSKFGKGRRLTKSEVKELREKAKAYRDNGGKYLEKVESK